MTEDCLSELERLLASLEAARPIGHARASCHHPHVEERHIHVQTDDLECEESTRIERHRKEIPDYNAEEEDIYANVQESVRIKDGGRRIVPEPEPSGYGRWSRQQHKSGLAELDAGCECDISSTELEQLLTSLRDFQTPDATLCPGCKEKITGTVVTAMNAIWHPEHFVCKNCSQPLAQRVFFEHDSAPFCEPCYYDLYSPRCAKCSQPILDRCITAMGRDWHPEHFHCAKCGKEFGEDGYHEHQDQAYCKICYQSLFAPTCVGCLQPITTDYISALNKHWHAKCFVCTVCHTKFETGTFFELHGRPYCEQHYHDEQGSICATCKEPITGRCMNAMGNKYHPDHFTCAYCLRQLNKGTFKETGGKPYCHDCFGKLLG